MPTGSAAECASVVGAAHYPPLGRRSSGGARPVADFPAYRAAVAEHMLVAVMIETVAGLEAVEAIAATPHLGIIFLGPHDLSLAMGEAEGSPAFEAALTRVLAAGKITGTPVGIYTASEQAANRAAQGFQFVVVASDLELNRAKVSLAWERFRDRSSTPDKS
jgi:2-dehydro-3-deoxyglucarate aldolase/4-hydroxy-2-oxoheptanedioate aldolase